MLEKYIYCGNKKLRCGYTTGSCAAAAAKAAAEMLLTGELLQKTSITTPKGISLELEVCECRIEKEFSVCAVVKDSGDDPDITNGIKIYVTAEKIPHGIEITGGEGIGTVTKIGLDQPIGAAAINSVPREMIRREATHTAEKYGYCGGFRFTVSAPEGRELAKKTYNPRMGIEGGISIIGTSGIVEPMSTSALIETIRMEERVRKAQGDRYLLLTPGNYGKAFMAEKMPFIAKKSVKCSNFIGEAIDAALEYGFEGILIVGHIGKLVKLGAGIMNTHSANADGRMDVLTTCAVIAGLDMEIIRRLPDCVTTDEAFGILENAGMLERVSKVLMNKIEFYLDIKTGKTIKIGAVAFSDKYGVIGRTSHAQELTDILAEEQNG